ncbi:MTH938/NDUFAF3 family protein [Alsobacter sp. SYSU M60028]|uniref:MTH938/NDUFAF3 family protein n=1 Tax=Alsobacter ponti TaxID=2962936 RepID=A0ABT1LEK8_9HYPH|nr:MTH938/NDUFAF3 family protein [Alsobacter ponti]MCP8939338.1 MTH938/NDUFAF3 family protein [Alsobacter ponti]
MSGGRRYEGFVPGRHIIDAYGNGGFRFADMSHRGSVLALPSGVRAWPVRAFSDLTPDAFAPVLAEAAEIRTLLLGTGAETVFLPEPLRALLRGAGIGIDAMHTGAAVRTYNVMLAEDRQVAAALIAVD